MISIISLSNSACRNLQLYHDLNSRQVCHYCTGWEGRSSGMVIQYVRTWGNSTCCTAQEQCPRLPWKSELHQQNCLLVFVCLSEVILLIPMITMIAVLHLPYNLNLNLLSRTRNIQRWRCQRISSRSLCDSSTHISIRSQAHNQWRTIHLLFHLCTCLLTVPCSLLYLIGIKKRILDGLLLTLLQARPFSRVLSFNYIRHRHDLCHFHLSARVCLCTCNVP